MDDSLIDTLEKRIKDMTDLRRIMNSMKHTLSEVKINMDDLKNFEKDLNDALKYTLQVKELDLWTLDTLKSFKKISESGGFRVLKGEKLGTLKTKEFIDQKKAKQALLERGIELSPTFEPEFSKILNQSVSMALDFLASKETAIETAQELIKPYRKPK